MNFDQRSQMVIARGNPSGVALEADDVIGVGRGISEGVLPQAFRVGGAYPYAMIAFIDSTSQRNPGLLQRADVLAQIHEDRGIRGKVLDPLADLAIEREAGFHVDLSFAIADGIGAPDCGIA